MNTETAVKCNDTGRPTTRRGGRRQQCNNAPGGKAGATITSSSRADAPTTSSLTVPSAKSSSPTQTDEGEVGATSTTSAEVAGTMTASLAVHSSKKSSPTQSIEVLSSKVQQLPLLLSLTL
jgi:hypothetical protein